MQISTTKEPRASRSSKPGAALDWLDRIVEGCGCLLRNNRIVLAITLTLLVGTLIVRLSSPINHDTAWYLYAGAQYLGGGELYRDVFVDVNPPLGFFLTMPPVLLAHLTGLFAVDLLVIYLYILIGASIVGIWWLCRADPDVPTVVRCGLVILATIVLTVSPAGQFGQREHFLIVLALPYLLLAVLTARNLSIPPSIAMTVGLVAGLGFALKPHFLLVPLALEVYCVAATRRWQTVLRHETVGLAVTLGAYAAVIIWVTPEYLTRIVPYALEVYNQAFQNPLWQIVRRAETAMLPVGCFVHLATRRHQSVPQLGDVFMIASAVFFITYVVQMKGWDYHLYPASSCLILGYGSLFLNYLSNSQKKSTETTETSLTRRIAIASFVLVAVLAGNAAVHLSYRNPYSGIMAPYVERYARNGWIALLASNVSAGFPLVIYSRVGWSSRFSTLWLLPGAIQKRTNGALADNEQAETAMLDDLENFTRESVIADLSARPPDVIIVDDRDQKSYFGGVPFDYLAYFGEDPRFARIWSDYVWVAEEFGFDVYRRRCAPNC